MTQSGDVAKPMGVVLAGGRASRLGMGSKALVSLAGRPMARHVIERLSPQADPVLLSVQEEDPELAALGCELVPDVVQRYRGPLTGLCSAMLRMASGSSDWLLLSPCDAPFLPLDLGPRLMRAAEATKRPVAAARYLGVVQPVFSLWHREALPTVRVAVFERGRGGLMRMLDDLPHALVDWSEQQPEPFLNINTPGELEQAGEMLDGMGGER